MALSKIQFGNIGRRNLIINGDMRIAQRGTTHTFQNGTGGYKTVDRWQIAESGTDSYVFEVSKSTDAPDDFTNSFKVDCTTADTSLGAGSQINFEQRIEAQNLQHLNYGTSSAKPLTLSFHVKSNKTGTYIVWFFQDDATRSISRSYTINSANTWEKKTMTIPGDTGGTINNDTESGFRVRFPLGAGTDYTSGTLQTSWGSSNNSADRYVGQVNLADSDANEWYITGVQLEVGETATEFEHRTIGEEIAACQRYFIGPINTTNSSGTKFVFGVNFGANSAAVMYQVEWPVQMRDNPQISIAASGSGAGTASTAYTGTDGMSLYYTSAGSGNVWLRDVTADAEI
tara:strand:+ start:1236 stop:2264 length:1029 start_codon:yes stop_codon:yes gene_type:complete